MRYVEEIDNEWLSNEDKAPDEGSGINSDNLPEPDSEDSEGTQTNGSESVENSNDNEEDSEDDSVDKGGYW